MQIREIMLKVGSEGEVWLPAIDGVNSSGACFLLKHILASLTAALCA